MEDEAPREQENFGKQSVYYAQIGVILCTPWSNVMRCLL